MFGELRKILIESNSDPLAHADGLEKYFHSPKTLSMQSVSFQSISFNDSQYWANEHKMLAAFPSFLLNS